MFFRSLVVALFGLALTSPALSQFTVEGYASSMVEMHRLVDPSSESRKTLFCIEISTKLEMGEARSTFIRRMERYTDDVDALLYAMAYVSGAFESNLIEIREGNLSAEVMAHLFGTQCMPLLLE